MYIIVSCVVRGKSNKLTCTNLSLFSVFGPMKLVCLLFMGSHIWAATLPFTMCGKISISINRLSYLAGQPSMVIYTCIWKWNTWSTLQLRRSMQMDTSRLYGMQDFAMDLFIYWMLCRTALSKEHPLIRTLLERIVSIAVQSFNPTTAECLSPVLSTQCIVLT